MKESNSQDLPGEVGTSVSSWSPMISVKKVCHFVVEIIEGGKRTKTKTNKPNETNQPTKKQTATKKFNPSV